MQREYGNGIAYKHTSLVHNTTRLKKKKQKKEGRVLGIMKSYLFLKSFNCIFLQPHNYIF